MFSNAVKIFTLSGIDIKLDPSWIVIATLITWVLSQQYFPDRFPELSQETHLSMALAAMLCFFASLLLHEFAHAYTAQRNGVSVKSITLFLLGGVAELNSDAPSPGAELRIAAAGPAMSLALSGAFWGLSGIAASVSFSAVMSYLAIVNLVLALFNLIPAFPLDGGRILRALLWHRSGDALRATSSATRLGSIFAHILFGAGVLNMLTGSPVAGLWYVMVSAFILLAARNTFYTDLAKSVFRRLAVRDLMSRKPLITHPNVSLDYLLNSVFLPNQISFAPVVEGGVLLGHVDLKILSGIDRENWPDTKVGDVYAGLRETPTVSPDLPAQTLMERMALGKARKFLVVDGHTLCGVITLSDLTAHLSQSKIEFDAPAGHNNPRHPS